MKQVNGYKCDYCHRVFGRKCDAARHEEACSCNPARRHCKTCVHCYFKEPVLTEVAPNLTVESYMPWNNDFTNVEFVGGMWCGKHDVSIREKPYNIECDTCTPYGYEEELPTPGTCFYYEYKGNAKTQTEEQMNALIQKGGTHD